MELIRSADDVKNVLITCHPLIRFQKHPLPTVTMPHAIIFDLEFTAWKNSLQTRWLRPGEFKETVQIGAIKVDARSFGEAEPFDALIRPRINPVLSDYLVNLTGITNEAVAQRGTDFVPAYERFVAFAAGGPIIAFGRDDLVLV